MKEYSYWKIGTGVNNDTIIVNPKGDDVFKIGFYIKDVLNINYDSFQCYDIERDELESIKLNDFEKYIHIGYSTSGTPTSAQLITFDNVNKTIKVNNSEPINIIESIGYAYTYKVLKKSIKVTSFEAFKKFLINTMLGNSPFNINIVSLYKELESKEV